MTSLHPILWALVVFCAVVAFRAGERAITRRKFARLARRAGYHSGRKLNSTPPTSSASSPPISF